MSGIMAHLVAGYPDYEGSFRVARALVEGGVSALEIQFPFSDPSADGPAIQEACTRSLERGFRVDSGFSLIERIRELAPSIPVFVMSYANIVYRNGVARFIEKAAAVGISGLIVPDLPPDSDEGLYAVGRSAGLDIVPVVAPDISDSRLELVRKVNPRYVYAALRTGITGAETSIGSGNIEFLERVRTTGGRIMAGFGIRNAEQVRALLPHVEYVVAGSVFVSILIEKGGDDAYIGVRRTAETLSRAADRSLEAGNPHSR